MRSEWTSASLILSTCTTMLIVFAGGFVGKISSRGVDGGSDSFASTARAANCPSILSSGSST
ncbi:hypothetical protein BC827DRAFT_1209667 [Russula dissimulans]|nr:hypothetical protein BC827DRAFT_1209667 [Russula dissimulans]